MDSVVYYDGEEFGECWLLKKGWFRQLGRVNFCAVKLLRGCGAVN